MGEQGLRQRRHEGRVPEGLEGILPPDVEDPQRAGAAVDPRLDPADEPVAVEERQDVVAPATPRGGDIDLPDVVEAVQGAEQLPVPGQRVERRQEGHAGRLVLRGARGVPVIGLGLGLREQLELGAEHVATPTHPFHGDRHEGAVGHELVEELSARRSVRMLRVGGRPAGPAPEFRPSAAAEQPMTAVARQQAVLELLPLGWSQGQQVSRIEPLHQVVDAPVPLAPGDAQDARLGQRLEDGPDLVRGTPVPVDGGARLDVGRGQRSVAPDPLQELLDERGVLVEGPALVRSAGPVPGQPVPRELGQRQQAEALVVGLEEDAVLVEERIGRGSPVVADPGEEHEIVVAPGHLEGIELDGAQPVEHREHALAADGQIPGRTQEVAACQEAPGGRGRHGPGWGHEAGW